MRAFSSSMAPSPITMDSVTAGSAFGEFGNGSLPRNHESPGLYCPSLSHRTASPSTNPSTPRSCETDLHHLGPSLPISARPLPSIFPFMDYLLCLALHCIYPVFVLTWQIRSIYLPHPSCSLDYSLSLSRPLSLRFLCCPRRAGIVAGMYSHVFTLNFTYTSRHDRLD